MMESFSKETSMDKRKVVVNLRRGPGDPLYDFLRDTLLSCHFEVIKTNYGKNEMDNLIAEVSKTDALISGVDLWGRDELERVTPGLKIICKIGTGVDNIDIEAARKCNIAVANTPGANANAVAEGAVALMLALSRRICAADRDMRKRNWINQILTMEIIGKTIGIVGYGHIGKRVISLLSGFSRHIMVYDPFINIPAEGQEYIRFSDFDTLVSECDVVSLHLPANRETYHMVNEQVLLKMKRSALLINTSRGSVIDEAALLRALKDGIIAGAALDVFEQEPLENSALLELENTVLTPHMLSGSRESAFNSMAMAAENLKAYFDGNPRHLL